MGDFGVVMRTPTFQKNDTIQLVHPLTVYPSLTLSSFSLGQQQASSMLIAVNVKCGLIISIAVCRCPLAFTSVVIVNGAKCDWAYGGKSLLAV